MRLPAEEIRPQEIRPQEIRPEELDGVDPAWSRFVEVPDAAGVTRRWHVLDNGAEPTVGTMLCVHGNPTWSYLWRRFLAQAPTGWRVVAVDHLGMGWSERLDAPRTLPERVSDLGTLTAALEITGPVVTVAHDWGGLISLGWALAHSDQLAGVVLTNTAVNLSVDAAPPGLIRLARTRALRQTVCVRTPVFLQGASALSRPRLPAAARRGLELPYGRADRRQSIGDFVADIPVGPDHPSRPAFDAIGAGLGALAQVPVLLLWGPRDPVFTERQLEDLLHRMPHADVQRYAGASHLVTEDAPQTSTDAWRWVGDLGLGSTGSQSGGAAERPASPASEPTAEGPSGAARPPRRPWDALLARAGDPAPAVVELSGGTTTTTSFAELERRVRDLAAGLAADGVRPGDRVALLVPPGVDLTVAVYAVWRVGAVIVVADAGLGLRGMAHALRSAGPDHVIGIGKALVAMAALRIPGRRIVAEPWPAALRRALGWGASLPELEASGRGRPVPELPPADAEAAVLFTSGATGPAKGVVYRLSQLRAQIDQLQSTYALTGADRWVAAFAPFALYGPALGVGAAVPDMSVTAPGTLTARALAEAVQAIEATVVFASPAALRNVVATASALTAEQRASLGTVRLLMSAGAPVPARLLVQVQELLPAAELHTPYGMTEALPLADISLPEIQAAGSGHGVCVGRPRPGVQVRLSPLDDLARAEGELTDRTGVTGEICVAAAHVKERYDRLWATERRSSRNPGWHRTGDVGHLDDQGRLWVEGRLVHVLSTERGPVTPVGLEQRVEGLAGVGSAAVVGVGPGGRQQVVVVVEPVAGSDRVRDGLADPTLTAAVRDLLAAGERPVSVAAVLVLRHLPVDIRHASKIDRAAVGRWAGQLLAGHRAP
ncbi:MAG: alpha/beta fold hydrolase, partial [Friedmanniella sp.]|nr:alpha/beta fold hydrolase [Friedmanniella sp.]